MRRTHIIRRVNPTGADLPDDEKAIVLAQTDDALGLPRPSGTGAITLKLSVSHENSTDRSTHIFWKTHGFSGSDVFDVFEAMFAEVESRLTAHDFKALADVFRSSGTDRSRLIESIS